MKIDTRDIFGTASPKMIVPMTTEEVVGQNHPFYTDSRTNNVNMNDTDLSA